MQGFLERRLGKLFLRQFGIRLESFDAHDGTCFPSQVTHHELMGQIRLRISTDELQLLLGAVADSGLQSLIYWHYSDMTEDEWQVLRQYID